jgi:IS30 family transposase
MQVSHEAIYRSLFIQTRGVLKKALMAHLPTTRQMRQAKGGTTKSGLGQIVDAASRPRPTIVPCQATGKETFSPEQTTRITEAAAPTAPAKLISAPGGGHCAQSLVA